MKDLTELIIIIDKSGSMYPLQDDVIGGYNALIKKQKEEGNARVTTVFFNDEVDFVHKHVDMNEVKPISDKEYSPSGCTALLDAIGSTILFVKAFHRSLEEECLPEHVIVSIMTDGLENASRAFNYPLIKDMIEEQKKKGWEFIFQAANIDTVEEARSLGIDEDMTMSFVADKKGIEKQMKCCSAKISSIRRNKTKK